MPPKHGRFILRQAVHWSIHPTTARFCFCWALTASYVCFWPLSCDWTWLLFTDIPACKVNIFSHTFAHSTIPSSKYGPPSKTSLVPHSEVQSVDTTFHRIRKQCPILYMPTIAQSLQSLWEVFACIERMHLQVWSCGLNELDRSTQGRNAFNWWERVHRWRYWWDAMHQSFCSSIWQKVLKKEFHSEVQIQSNLTSWIEEWEFEEDDFNRRIFWQHWKRY